MLCYYGLHLIERHLLVPRELDVVVGDEVKDFLLYFTEAVHLQGV